jgi:hypothetical protein
LPLDEIHDDLQPGDYWRVANRHTGEPMRSAEPSNLTGTCWHIVSPLGGGVGLLMKHTVREEDDGTISIRRDDGSSNSVAITTAAGYWHGFVEHGVWTSC